MDVFQEARDAPECPKIWLRRSSPANKKFNTTKWAPQASGGQIWARVFQSRAPAMWARALRALGCASAMWARAFACASTMWACASACVPWVHPGPTQGPLRVFPGSTQGLPWVYPGPTQGLPRAFLVLHRVRPSAQKSGSGGWARPIRRCKLQSGCFRPRTAKSGPGIVQS